jgi:hypothetical protein
MALVEAKRCLRCDYNIILNSASCVRVVLMLAPHQLHPIDLFVLPKGSRPLERWQPLEHVCGAKGVSDIEITVVKSRKLAALVAIAQIGIVIFKIERELSTEIEFDDGRSGATLDCRSDLPLVLRW